MGEFFDRRIFGRKARGVRLEPTTRQNVVFAKHSGDVAFILRGNDAVAKESELKVLNRQEMLCPVKEPNLNVVGENKTIIKRKEKGLVVKLD